MDCRSIKRTFYVEEIRDRVYAVTFTPQARGKHRVFVYLNGMEVISFWDNQLFSHASFIR